MSLWQIVCGASADAAGIPPAEIKSRVESNRYAFRLKPAIMPARYEKSRYVTVGFHPDFLRGGLVRLDDSIWKLFPNFSERHPPPKKTACADWNHSFRNSYLCGFPEIFKCLGIFSYPYYFLPDRFFQWLPFPKHSRKEVLKRDKKRFIWILTTYYAFWDNRSYHI